MAQLVVPKPLNPLDDVAKYLGIKSEAQGLKVQQQQIQQSEMNAQQQAALQAIFKDPASYDPTTKEPTDDALMKANGIHPGIAAEMSKALGRDPVSLEQAKNLKSEQVYRDAQAGNLKRDDERAIQAAKDVTDRKNAEEAAGVLVPGSEANVLVDKVQKRSSQYKVRQPDGSYKYETRYSDPLYEKPATETEYDQQLKAFNADPALSKQFGSGPIGFGKYRQQQSIDTAKAGRADAAAIAAAKTSGNPGLEGVLPNLIAPAAAAAEKHQAAYTDAVQSAGNMKTFLEQAKAGNKQAYAEIPMEGVLQITTSAGVKRINMAEMEQYGSAGSILDWMKANLGKRIYGTSIPDNILKDMGALSEGIAANSKKAYEQKINGVNKIYGSKFDPSQLSGENSAAGIVIDPAGVEHQVSDVEAAIKLHPGTRRK